MSQTGLHLHRGPRKDKRHICTHGYGTWEDETDEPVGRAGTETRTCGHRGGRGVGTN